MGNDQLTAHQCFSAYLSILEVRKKNEKQIELPSPVASAITSFQINMSLPSEVDKAFHLATGTYLDAIKLGYSPEFPLSNRSNMPPFSSIENCLALKIYQILWRETDPYDIDDVELSILPFYCIFLYLYGSLPEGHLFQLWRSLYLQNKLNERASLRLSFFIHLSEIFFSTPEEKFSFSSFCQTLLQVKDKTGIPLPGLIGCVEFWNELHAFFSLIPQEDELILVEKLTSLYDSYLHTSLSVEELLGLTHEEWNLFSSWISPDDISSYVSSGLEDYIEDHSSRFQTIEDFSKLSKSPGILSNLPINLNTLGSKIDQLTPRVISPQEISKVPPLYVKEFAKRLAYSAPQSKSDLKIYFPGGDGIGHSCVLVRTNYGVILLDFGMSVATSSSPRWLALMQKADAVFLTHAHLDHSGALPLFQRWSKQNDVPIYGTKETLNLTQRLLGDTRNILGRTIHPKTLESDKRLLTLTKTDVIEQVTSSFREITVGETVPVLPDLSVVSYPAGHLFGSVGYEIIVGNKSIFYTGDFNIGNKFFQRGKVSFPNDVNYMIFDGTYFSRYGEAENAEQQLIHILKTHKRIIIPAFTTGRSQEILYNLRRIKADSSFRIILAGMGGRIARDLLGVKNSPRSVFTGVKLVGRMGEEEFQDNVIVIAGQGMAQAGVARKLIEFTKDDPDVAVVFCGYQAPGTFGFHWLQGNSSIVQRYKQRVYRIRLSGHTNGDLLDKFLDKQSGQKIIVHTPQDLDTDLDKNDLLAPSRLEKGFL